MRPPRRRVEIRDLQVRFGVSERRALRATDWPRSTHRHRTYLGSDNGPELTARALREGWGRLNVKTLYIEPGSPWENGYVESFIGKLRDELLDREIFYTLHEARVLVERWRQHYNWIRPHSALG